ncbi:MAG: adenosine kinase [Gammaproteobacteria bacterium]|nr:adenosine kinase [Gammaproteobacteria bacterium]
MNRPQIDVFGIGNALLDVEYRVTDTFLVEHGIEKRRMTLVDKERMLRLINSLEEDPISSNCGGSVANTMYAMRGFGRRTYLTCRVAPDDAGRHFVMQLESAGIGTNTILPSDDGVTGRCLVLVTRDAERTMNTCLGVSDQLLSTQVDTATLHNSRSIFIEGYLASSDTGHVAAQRAREIADEYKLETNLTLADTSMVKMFRPQLETIIGNGLTRVFANLEEALEWCRTDRLDIALTQLREIAREAVITLGPGGCSINTGKTRIHVDAFPVKAIDLNGAGDMFAAAYLTAIRDHDTESAARFANFAASRVIQYTGARLRSTSAYDAIRRQYLTIQEKALTGQVRVSSA